MIAHIRTNVPITSTSRAPSGLPWRNFSETVVAP
jgi:hypothetical protein